MTLSYSFFIFFLLFLSWRFQFYDRTLTFETYSLIARPIYIHISLDTLLNDTDPTRRYSLDIVFKRRVVRPLLREHLFHGREILLWILIG